MKPLSHLTLNTGHVTVSSRDEVTMSERYVVTTPGPEGPGFSPRDESFLFPTSAEVRSAGPTRKSSDASCDGGLVIAADETSVTVPVPAVNSRVCGISICKEAIKILGTADDSPCKIAGAYVVEFNPDDYSGRGALKLTGDPIWAIQFHDLVAAVEY